MRIEGIITKSQAHWDSRNEYDKFRRNEKPNKNSGEKRIRILLVPVLCLAFAAAVIVFHGRQKDSPAEPVAFEQDVRSKSIVDASPGTIPDYSGTDVIELNGNKPGFTQADYDSITGENYSDLDILGRCGTAVAMLDRKMMPTGERESIEQIRPTGWVQKKYPGIVDSEPPYLYNRSHLIAYALTGQNANEKNLITGTRYMNATTMLPYEEQVMRYLDNSENHVLYRISPYFKGIELLARGVEMEAYSVEDGGKGVCFHVFVYNVQPGIELDYRTGENRKK